MKLLETKEELTLNDLLRIAYEYGNDSADMPADAETVDNEFSEWIENAAPLFKKLIMPRIKNKIITRAIHFIATNTNSDSQRIGAAIIEELKQVKLFAIPDVSQQRELLNFIAKDWNKKQTTAETCLLPVDIERYIKEFNLPE